jgi:hypothetical protein
MKVLITLFLICIIAFILSSVSLSRSDYKIGETFVNRRFKNAIGSGTAPTASLISGTSQGILSVTGNNTAGRLNCTDMANSSTNTVRITFSGGGYPVAPNSVVISQANINVVINTVISLNAKYFDVNFGAYNVPVGNILFYYIVM